MVECQHCKSRVKRFKMSEHMNICKDDTLFCTYCFLGMHRTFYSSHLKICQDNPRNISNIDLVNSSIPDFAAQILTDK